MLFEGHKEELSAHLLLTFDDAWEICQKISHRCLQKQWLGVYSDFRSKKFSMLQCYTLLFVSGRIIAFLFIFFFFFFIFKKCQHWKAEDTLTLAILALITLWISIFKIMPSDMLYYIGLIKSSEIYVEVHFNRVMAGLVAPSNIRCCWSWPIWELEVCNLYSCFSVHIVCAFGRVSPFSVTIILLLSTDFEIYALKFILLSVCAVFAQWSTDPWVL